MRQSKVNGAKDAVLFHQHLCQNLTLNFRLHLLHRAPYFGAVLPKAVAINSIKNYVRKCCCAFALKI
jgi:hypothetical protein